MDTQKQQIVDSVKQANNILVTVSNNPSVDQLAACIGLTLALNKMKKHATAVFSGAVPPIIDFLQPEKTLEKTTDSLRDFIIAIDKAKADKLRYKVEDKFVKIFITPYRTSISQKDLEFSEGDFNVDVVLALGVHKQTDLDQAITAHGRIMHDATVISINNQPNIELGSINLLEPKASSLSEITVELLDLLDKSMVDSQIATALLTGIVAETDRFRNAKTTPITMSVSAELLTAGANQQLVASKLDAPAAAQRPIAQMGTTGGNTSQTPAANKPDDGTLEINHDEAVSIPRTTSSNDGVSEPPKPAQIHIDEHGQFRSLDENKSTGGELPPLPPAQPMGPMPGSLPPLGGQPTSPSPLNPFASPPGQYGAGGGLGLPPLPPSQNSQGQTDVAGQLPLASSLPPLNPLGSAPPPSLPPLPPAQPMGPMPGSLPPLGGQPTSPSPLNPFASPPGPQASPQQVEPSVVSPAIIQPDPNAVRQVQEEEPVLPPKSEFPPTIHTEGPHLMMQPPTFGSQLNAGISPQDEDEEGPSGAAMSLPQIENQTPLLQREPLQSQPSSLPPLNPLGSAPPPSLPPLPPAQSMGPMPSVSLPPPLPPKVELSPATQALGGGQTEPPVLAEESLTSLERDVRSPHLDYIESPAPNLPPPPPPPPVPASLSATPPPSIPSTEPVTSDNATSYTTQDQEADVEHARDAILDAFQSDSEPASSQPLEPVASLNAQPLGSPLHGADDPDAPPPGFSNDPNDGSMPPPPAVPPPLIPPTPS